MIPRVIWNVPQTTNDGYQPVPAKGIPLFLPFPPKFLSFHCAEGTHIPSFTEGIPRKDEEFPAFLPWKDEGKERKQKENPS